LYAVITDKAYLRQQRHSKMTAFLHTVLRSHSPFTMRHHQHLFYHSRQHGKKSVYLASA